MSKPSNQPANSQRPSRERLQSLLSLIALKNESALEQLYQHLSAHLYGLIVRIVKRQDWADEILQETFIRVWDHASRYRSERSHPVTWVVSIARNRAIDYLRQAANREILSEQDEIDALLDQAVMTDGNEVESLANEIIECLEQLENNQRTAITLAYYQGYTHQELTKQLDSPLGTIKSWIRRGLLQLKRCLNFAD